MLWFMGSQRVGHDWGTELNWTEEINLHVSISSVQFSCSVMSDSLQPYGLQHARPPCPSRTPGVYSNSCPLSWWCHSTISSSVIPFCFCLQSFSASWSFPTSHLYSYLYHCYYFLRLSCKLSTILCIMCLPFCICVQCQFLFFSNYSSMDLNVHTY